MEDALEAVGSRLDARPMGSEPPRPSRGVVDREDLANLVEGQLELA